MCTVIILRRPGHPWPFIFAANRDEMLARPWRPPGRHWPHRPEVVAGLDETSGGSWLGLNDHGVLAAVLNRVNSLGPAPGKRSRGELVLEALDHADASTAAAGLSHLDPAAYRSFNLVIADHRAAFWLRNLGEDPIHRRAAARVEIFELPAGLSMITAQDRNDWTSARIRSYLPRFEAAEPPDPKTGKWSVWTKILKSRRVGRGGGPEAAMTIVTDFGFATVSSSVIALPGPPKSLRGPPNRPVWRFAAGRPDQTPYRKVQL